MLGARCAGLALTRRAVHHHYLSTWPSRYETLVWEFLNKGVHETSIFNKTNKQF